jgi:hypothetical protein
MQGSERSTLGSRRLHYFLFQAEYIPEQRSDGGGDASAQVVYRCCKHTYIDRQLRERLVNRDDDDTKKIMTMFPYLCYKYKKVGKETVFRYHSTPTFLMAQYRNFFNFFPALGVPALEKFRNKVSEVRARARARVFVCACVRVCACPHSTKRREHFQKPKNVEGRPEREVGE